MKKILRLAMLAQDNNIMRFIDEFLNNITMYRLVLYFLIVLVVVGFIYSIFNVLPLDPINYLFSFVFILTVSYIANKVFAVTYEAPLNIESWWISALILGLIITPPKNLHQVIFVGFAATLAMASKYILAIKRKLIFNPVAIAVFLTAIFINGTASWWIGTSPILPFVAIGGFLVLRKLQRWDLALSFLIITTATTFFAGWVRGVDPVVLVFRDFTDTAMLFFVSIMLTEPLTTPPTRGLRIFYGALVGFLFAPQVHFGSIFLTPEIALIIGNIFSYFVSPKYKLLLTIKERIKLSPTIYDFVFATTEPVKFTPGQYMEFTFEHPKADDRGNRRYLSLANSPTESDIHLGIKFENPPSSFKRNFFSIHSGEKLVASQLIGDFTMPRDTNQKLVFIAGGIGITPYRSMLKYLIDTNQKRDIALVYTARNPDEFVYKDVIEQAKDRLGIKVVYHETGREGRISAEYLAQIVPDYHERTFYISGSQEMVKGFDQTLNVLGIPATRIVKDYFPGFA